MSFFLAEIAFSKHLESFKGRKSYEDVESVIRVHILPRWGKTRLTDMNSRAVAQWLGEKRAQGLCGASGVRIDAVAYGAWTELHRN